MAIAYKSQGAGAATDVSATALSPVTPAIVDANDILIAHICIRDTTTTPSTPSGWTQLGGGAHQAGSTAQGRHWVYGKLAAGTEDNTSVSFGATGTNVVRCARIYSFSGYSSGSITDVVTGFAFASNTTAAIADVGVTTTVASAMAVNLVYVTDDNALAAYTGQTGGTWTEPVAEFTTILGLDAAMQIQTAVMASTGTINGGSQTMAASDPWGAYGFEIRPSPPAGGTTFPQALTASTVIATGALTRRTSKPLTASTVATIGALGRQAAKLLTGALIIGALVRKQATKTLTGTTAAAGTLTAQKVFLRALSATVATAATLSRQAAKTLTATVAATGVLARRTAKALTAAAATTATLTRQAAKTLTDTIVAAGSLLAEKITSGGNTFQQALTATVAATGTLQKRAAKTLTDTAAATATLTRRAAKTLTDTTAATGALTGLRVFLRTLTATVGTAATLTRRTAKTLTDTTAATGTLTRRTAKTLTDTTAATATLTALRVFLRTLTATVATTGTVTRRTAKQLTAAVPVIGTISKRVGKAASAVAGTIAGLVGQFVGPSTVDLFPYRAQYTEPSYTLTMTDAGVEYTEPGYTLTMTDAGATSYQEPGGLKAIT